MIQYLACALIVACALLYVGAKYLPQGWRTRIVYTLTRRGASRQSKLVQWLDTAGSCGSGCDTCKACEDTPAPPQEGGRRVIKLHVEK
jgi:hypothetical protein